MRHGIQRALAAGALIALAVSPARAPAQDLVAKTEALAPADEQAAFRLPDGFEAQLVAAEPMIQKPMNIAFDDRGRLWVACTVEYPYPAPEGRAPRDSIRILEDFGPDGRARKMTVFAVGLNIPIGVLPIGSGREALAHGIPNIFRFVDTDGDGKADKREVAYGTYGFRDTHGMTSAFHRGFDGWIYACHGFANDSRIQGSDGRALALQSGNTYRMRPDGSHVEPFTHGQVNPFGLCFDRFGDLFSADCHSRPLYLLLRGAYYPSFGKPHDGLGFCPEITNDEHGSTGIAGVVVYEDEQYPEPWRGTVFIGNPVTSRINHDRLDWRGSTPKVVRQPDFLTSADPWFRPVDLRLGPDGALYVADFYNRIIGHYEVPLEHPGRDRERGRIWRIVYRGKHGDPAPPDLAAANLGALASALAHPNLEVRKRAGDQIVERFAKDQAVPPLLETKLRTETEPESARVQALWGLHRLGALSEELLTIAARGRSNVLRVHAMRSIRERESVSDRVRGLAQSGLNDPDARVRRAAAEALGRHPSPGQIGTLLAAWKAAPRDDELLIHAIRISLRDQLNLPESWAALPRELPAEDSSKIAEIALGVASNDSAIFLLDRLIKGNDRRDENLRRIARYGDSEVLRRLTAWVREGRSDDLASRSRVLRSVDQGLRERGASLAEDLRDVAVTVGKRLLASTDDADVKAGTELAEGLKLQPMVAEMVAFGLNAARPAHQRAWALAASSAIDPVAAADPLGRVVKDRSAFLGLRNHMAQVLGTIRRPEARASLLDAIVDAPSDLQTIIAQALAGDREGAAKLIEAVSAGKVSRLVLVDRVVENRLKGADLGGLAERLADLRKDLPTLDQKIKGQMDHRRQSLSAHPPNSAAGRAVFEKHCAICHQIDGKGAKVGPQLDGVGVRGADRILEDILDPNRNVDQAFRTTALELDNGQVRTGLLLREEGQVLVMADSEGKEVRVDSSQVQTRKLSSISPMPANFNDRVSDAEFAQLIHFLLSRTERGAGKE